MILEISKLKIPIDYYFDNIIRLVYNSKD